MPALGHYLLQYFPIFVLGSIFGKVMSDSGAAYSIANFITKTRTETRNLIRSFILRTSHIWGRHLFVVAFTIYPIALTLFQQAQIPRRLIPGAIAFGSFTFTMTALPGTPAIQNAIPMRFLVRLPFAAPLLGSIATLVMFIFGMFWLLGRAKKHRARRGI